MHQLLRRVVLICAAIGATLALLAPSMVNAAFPDRNITLVVTFSPGGGYDSIARAVARSMGDYLPKGVHVIVKNVTGAGGVRGQVAIYRAKPDGYTIGHMQASGMLGLQMLRGAKVGYDTNKYTWLARVGADPFGLFVAGNGPYKSVADLQKAKRVTWGVESIGVGRWFGSFFAAKTFGIDFQVVAGYGGTGESLPALLRRDFDVWAQPIDHPSVVSYLFKDLLPIAQLDDKNPVSAPEVPTSKQLGYNLTFSDLRAMGGPPGIPAERAEILQDLLLKAMNDKQYLDWKKQSNIVLQAGTGEDVTKDLVTYTNLFEKYLPEMKRAAGQ